MYTVDIDVGGTLTDGLFSDGKAAIPVKVDTTPHDLTVCFQGFVEIRGFVWSLFQKPYDPSQRGQIEAAREPISLRRNWPMLQNVAF